MSARRYGWPFVPTSADGTWNFDLASYFDLQPVYLPAEGVRRRAELADMPRGTASEQEAYALASAAMARSEDVTTSLLDQAPAMYRLLFVLTSSHLTLDEAQYIIASAERLLAAIYADIDSHE